MCISTHLPNKPECQQKGFYLKYFLHEMWKRSRRTLGRQHKNLQQGEQEQQQKRGEDTGWGRGRGQPGGSLVSWMAFRVRFFPHDLIMGGISHNGSRQCYVKINLKKYICTQTHENIFIVYKLKCMLIKWILVDLSRECMLLGSLSRHNKNLEWWTLKPLGGSQLSEDRPCYSSQV